jgi:hypothetical protein
MSVLTLNLYLKLFLSLCTAPPPQSHLGEQVNDITHCLIFVLNEIRLCAQF